MRPQRLSSGAGGRLKCATAPRRAIRSGCAGVAVLLLLTACSSTPQPQQPDARNDLCGSCRMPVSDPSLASQIVAPGEEPRFFDDLRCLRDYLTTQGATPRGAVIYVADHRTREWVKASRAVFASLPSTDTPMGSHWVAYADEKSRLADPHASEGSVIPAEQIFGAAAPQGK